MTKSLSIRTGDKVRVIAGKDKGKEGQGPARLPEQAARRRRGREHDQEGARARPRRTRRAASSRSRAPIHVSNVMLVCPSCCAADARRPQARGRRARARLQEVRQRHRQVATWLPAARRAGGAGSEILR